MRHRERVMEYDWALTTDALQAWNSVSSLCDTYLTASLIMTRMREEWHQEEGVWPRHPLWLWPVILLDLVSDPGSDIVTEGSGRGQSHLLQHRGEYSAKWTFWDKRGNLAVISSSSKFLDKAKRLGLNVSYSDRTWRGGLVSVTNNDADHDTVTLETQSGEEDGGHRL